MASKLSPGNALTARAQKWKKDQRIISLTFDKLLNTLKGKKFIAEQKVDGQSAIMEYKNEKARFGSLGGRIISEIPALIEIEKIFKNKKINYALMVGELAGVENGKIIHFDKTESLIKNPSEEKEALHWFPYQALKINDEEYGEGLEGYLKGWAQIKALFKNAKYVEPVKAKDTDIKKFWDLVVTKQGNEGLVIRTEDGKVYKSKPTFTYDLVVIAVGSKKGKNWPKRMIGNTLMAFMDEDRVFRVAGEIGTGWSDKEKKELFSWAQKNKVGEDDTYVWVRPEKIIETQWERSNIRDGLAYKYERGKYEKLDKRPVGTIVKPRFIQYRTDKSVNPKDLRLTQIPNWKKTKKMAHRIASTWVGGVLC
jgi:ATP-dependent DNA ligase